MVVITIIIIAVMIILLILRGGERGGGVTIAILRTYAPKCFLLPNHVKKATLCILANTFTTMKIHLAWRIPRLCKK